MIDKKNCRNAVNTENKKISHTMQKAAPILVAAAAVLWGILVIFVRKLNAGGLEAMDIVSVRVYGSTIILFPGIAIFQKTSHKSGMLKIVLKDTWCFLGTGIVSIVFFSYCYFRNVEVSSVALSSILMYTSPVWVTILSAICFREKLNYKKGIALLMALAGCVLVSGIIKGNQGMDTSGIPVQGILLGLGSGIGYGLYSIFGRYALNKGYHPMTVSAYTFLFACIGVLPFVEAERIFGVFYKHPQLIVWVVCIALFSTCLSFTLYTIGLRYMEPGRAAVLATLEPIVSTVVGVVYYKEPLTGLMVLGVLLVLGASVLISWK